MAKIIIDQRMLGHNNFIMVAFKYADIICKERNMSREEMEQISQELNSCSDVLLFKEKYDKYFKDEIKLKLDNDNI